MTANKNLLIAVLSILSCFLLAALLFSLRSNQSILERNRLLDAKLAEATRTLAKKKLNSLTVSAANTSNPNTGTSGNPDRVSPFIDPNYAWLWKRQSLRNVWSNFGRGISALGLSDNDRKRLEELLVAKNQAAFDALDAAVLANLPETERGLAVQQTISAIDAEIIGLIGKDGEKSLEDRSAIEGWNASVESGVAIDLSESGQPLSSQQKNQLALAMFQSSNFPLDKPDDSPEAKGELSKQGTAIMSRAANFLTPEQLAVLRQYEIEQLRQWQYNESH